MVIVVYDSRDVESGYFRVCVGVMFCRDWNKYEVHKEFGIE